MPIFMLRLLQRNTTKYRALTAECQTETPAEEKLAHLENRHSQFQALALSAGGLQSDLSLLRIIPLAYFLYGPPDK
jgi:hypothetical protein